MCWHLPQQSDAPLLVVAASPRVASVADARIEPVIETGFRLLVEALGYIAAEHREWALSRLPAKGKAYNRARARLGVSHFDVESRPDLVRYLTDLYGARLSVAEKKGKSPRVLRLDR